jgi:hypothetical protein
MMMKRFAIGAVVLACWPVTAEAAAPNALIGKSVTVSWNETRSQRDVGAESAFHPVSIPFTFTMYYGTGGHVFKRMFTVAASRRASGSEDKVGGGGAAISFSGNKMIGTNSFGGAARRIEITFDGNFSSCAAQVVTAKLAGAKTAVVKSIATGGMIEFESVSAGSASCAIAQGNPFAN